IAAAAPPSDKKESRRGGMRTDATRRDFLGRTAAAGAVTLAAGFAPAAKKKPKEPKGEDVSPAEDLMREHGALKRGVLVYGEAIGRLDSGQDLPPEPVADAAKVIRSFIEDYHEKLEEDFLFPRFRKARKLVDLVDVLAAQHHAGRRLTETTTRLATAASLKDSAKRRDLADSMAVFIRMYAPHEAREATVLVHAFPSMSS